MPELKIKPLSINEAYRGRRFKAKAYKQFERDVLLLLPPLEIPEGELEIIYDFGFSSRGSDYDNAVKPFQDVLQKKYGFDDNRIYAAHIYKRIVPKGSEYIGFRIQAVGAIAA